MILGLVLVETALAGQSGNVDFRNFTYPFEKDPNAGSRVRLRWMSNDIQTKVTLVKGRYEVEENDPAAGPYGGPYVALAAVHYGEIIRVKQLDAIVVLHYDTGGTSSWDYLYMFDLSSTKPRLVSWLRTGEGGCNGLHSVEPAYPGFILDLLDPEKASCHYCSSGFIRHTFTWTNGRFVHDGPLKYGRVEDAPQPLKR
jgi:hypothetical protein